jgi:type VI secretion system secreted protein VgrG
MSLFEMISQGASDLFAPAKKAAVDFYDRASSDSALGSDVDGVMAKSPLLTENVEKLRAEGWTIRYGDEGVSSECDEANKIISIARDKRADPEEVARSLAHETGHALYEEPAVEMEGMTRDEYVEAEVDRSLRDEAEAHIMNLRVRDEILGMDGRGPDIGLSGHLAPAYKALWSHYSDATHHETLREEIAQLFRDEVPGGDRAVSYYDYYADGAEAHWDRKHRDQ